MKAELVALQPQLVTTVAEVEALIARVAKEKAEVGPGAFLLPAAGCRTAFPGAAAYHPSCLLGLRLKLPTMSSN
jgi:hypothetical protein